MDTHPGLPDSPLVDSLALREAAGLGRAQLKLETGQPTGSFKDRGMRVICRACKQDGARRVVCSSGGNAGLAATAAARSFGMEALVFVPASTNKMMADKIRRAGATVEVSGENWNGADLAARKAAEEEGNAYVPPFDHELLWQGHSSMVDELVRQREGVAPDLIVVSVGGGGLLAGVLYGLARHGGEWATKTKVVAAETEGAASMSAALKAGKLVRLEAITTIATTLGALQVSQDALDKALAHPAGCYSVVVSDKEAIEGCLFLADEQRVLVEPSCGTALGALRRVTEGKTDVKFDKPMAEVDAVLVVCGGSAITLDMLAAYKEQFGS